MLEYLLYFYVLSLSTEWTLENKENHQLMQNTFMHFLPVHYLIMDSIFAIQSKVTNHFTKFQEYSMEILIYSCDEIFILLILSITDSAFKKIKILQEASLEHHPTTVSCPTPARRRHRTTFTQVVSTATLDYIAC